MSSRFRGGAVLARQTSQAEKDVTLLRLSAVGGCHLPTDRVRLFSHSQARCLRNAKIT